MNEDRFWLLVSLKLSGEATPEELIELELLLKRKPEMGLRADALATIWLSKSGGPVLHGDSSFNKHMQRLSTHFAEPVLKYENMIEVAEALDAPLVVRRRVFSRIVAWTAGIAASLLVGWVVFDQLNTPPKSVARAQPQNTVSTKRGSKSKIQLPDGTQVWLNADSKITYNEKFQGALREVQLTGEAFFDVVRDETRPFVIHTNSIDVRVLGTTFNVRSYEDEKNTETSLIHGSVEVTLRNNPDKKIVLKPNEKLIVNNDNFIAAARTAEKIRTQPRQPALTLGKINFEKGDSSVIETLWVKNKLAFDGEAFEDVALKIERWFDVKVNITDEKLRKVTFSGVFDNESLQVVMEALQMTGKFRYCIAKKEVTIGR